MSRPDLRGDKCRNGDSNRIRYRKPGGVRRESGVMAQAGGELGVAPMCYVNIPFARSSDVATDPGGPALTVGLIVVTEASTSFAEPGPNSVDFPSGGSWRSGEHDPDFSAAGLPPAWS